MSEHDRHRVARFAASLAALLAMVVAVPAGLLIASRARFGSGNPLAGVDPPWRWAAGDASDAVSGPLADDTVIDGLIRLSLCIAWVAVAVIVVTTVIEVVHAIRHRGLPLPDVRGLGWAQAVGRFVAVGLVAVLPLATPATSLASAFEARTVDATVAARTSASEMTAPTRTGLPAQVPVEDPATGTTHLVAPGESVYAIAVGLAGGDQSRVIGIADAIIDANLGAVMPGGQRFTNPAYIEVGWILQIPAGVATAPNPARESVPLSDGQTYVVEQGDTLWEIAGEQLGDPEIWPEIWERNAGDDMGDGRTFDDPNLLLPGWELDLADPAPSEVSSTPDAPPPPAPPPTEPAPVLVTPNVVPTDPIPTSDALETPVVASIPTTPPPGTTTSPSGSPSTSPSTVASDAATSHPAAETDAPAAPSPIRIEHAALVAAGILALVGVRRRQRLRSAMPRHRLPEPRAAVTDTERRLRSVDAGERAMRVDVACRAAAWSLIDTDSQIGWIEVSGDGEVRVRLTAPAGLPLPWTGEGQSWRLGADVPVEVLAEDARQVGQPCVALVQLGITPSGYDVIVDLEACGVLAVVARTDQADEVVTGIATALASSLFAEVAHLIGVSLPESALLDHRNAHIAESADAALELAGALAGTTATNERSSFELRSRRTGGEMWEPAIVLLRSADDGADVCRPGHVPAAGHGVAMVAADEHERIPSPPARLVAHSDGWRLEAFGSSIDITPVGVCPEELAAVTELLRDADRDLEPADPIDEIQWSSERSDAPARDTPGPTPDEGGASPATPYQPPAYEVVVGLLGGVDVRARTGERGSFERSKTVELIAWLATHRDRATRTRARTALWELDVRDATFANVVSEARRGLARLVPPPEGEEWVARTLTEQLPLHDLVVTDADLVNHRLTHARLQPPTQAIETLRPAVDLVRDMPFAGTSYLWPDAEGISSNLVLLAITVAAEFAGHALSLGDTDAVFWATGQGLRVLPGHEELIALRMRAHASSGDLAGVSNEWESYERVLVADAWSDGEPAPKLLALRQELLTTVAT